MPDCRVSSIALLLVPIFTFSLAATDRAPLPFDEQAKAQEVDSKVTNMRASQLADGTKKVDVRWDPAANMPADTSNTQVKAAVIAANNASGGETTVTLPGGVTMVLAKIPAGSFQMGSPDAERGRYSDEGPVHPVTISLPFYLGETEVTQAQWEAVMGSNPAHDYGVGPTNPVYYVSWDDIAGAGGFIEKLNQYLGTTRFRLPSEAEWEYAARGGTTTRFSYGDVLECGDTCETCDLHAQHMWWCGDNQTLGSKPVGSKTANPFGLFDMNGNLYEWVQDWYHNSYTGAPADGSAWESPPGLYRLVRGGYWGFVASYCRSAFRGSNTSDYRSNPVGFRLAANVEAICTLTCTAGAMPSSGTLLLAVVFSANATPSNCAGSPTFAWFFGDGTSSAEQNPSKIYSSAGSYTWALMVSVDGQICSASGTVTVTPGVPGDCDGSGTVSIGEVQKAINMFLGSQAVGCGVDCNSNGTVSIGEVQKVINAFLGLASLC